MTTADRVQEKLQSFDLKGRNGKFTCNSPLREGSNSHAFNLTIEPCGEKGAYHDHVTGESGSLYELAEKLNVPIERPADNTSWPTAAAANKPSKRSYAGIDDYAAEHGITPEVLRAAGWKPITHARRPALAISTAHGARYRFLDGDTPTYKSPQGYTHCWYKLSEAVQIAQQTGQALVICNGEISTVAAQHHGVAAAAITTGEGTDFRQDELDELRQAWQGPIIVALDCDRTGRESAITRRNTLATAGFNVRAVDLDTTATNGLDLADFCRLHGTGAAAALRTLPELAATPTTQAQPKPQIIDVPKKATDLLRKQFAPIQWVIPEVLPEGLTMCAGAPKLGKSWLWLNVALAVASGGAALGQIEVEQGDVLYLALEDNERRLQRRLIQMGAAAAGVPETFEYATTWQRLDQGGLISMEEWIKTHNKPRLIVVDTLVQVKRPSSSRGSLYEQDYSALQGLKHLSDTYGIGIVIIHHTNKGDHDDVLNSISGTNGLSGGVDNVIVLRRARGDIDAELHVTGRDIEDKELALTFDKQFCIWTMKGNAAEYRVSKERLEIINLLRTADDSGIGPREIASAIGKPYDAIRQLLSRMTAEGQVRPVSRGKYVLVIIPNNPPTIGSQRSQDHIDHNDHKITMTASASMAKQLSPEGITTSHNGLGYMEALTADCDLVIHVTGDDYGDAADNNPPAMTPAELEAARAIDRGDTNMASRILMRVLPQDRGPAWQELNTRISDIVKPQALELQEKAKSMPVRSA